jgi:thymidylate synthase
MNNNLNTEYHKLINKIETQGSVSAPRGLKVKELEMERLTINPLFAIPDFEVRPFNFKYFLGEMSWYLKRDRNIDYINHFSSFWKNIADENNEINSNYGFMLFGEQLQWALDSLLNDKNTRQAIAFVSRPSVQYKGNKDFVCTIYLNFWIKNDKLNMKVQMRSNDIFYGLSYDAPFFAFVQQTMWKLLRDKYTELELGTYYHCADNIHFYERHFELADQIVKEKVKEPIMFLLREPLFTLSNNEMELTSAGKQFISDVDSLVESGEKITQEISKQILTKYFFIQ